MNCRDTVDEIVEREGFRRNCIHRYEETDINFAVERASGWRTIAVRKCIICGHNKYVYLNRSSLDGWR